MYVHTFGVAAGTERLLTMCVGVCMCGIKLFSRVFDESNDKQDYHVHYAHCEWINRRVPHFEMQICLFRCDAHLHLFLAQYSHVGYHVVSISIKIFILCQNNLVDTTNHFHIFCSYHRQDTKLFSLTFGFDRCFLLLSYVELTIIHKESSIFNPFRWKVVLHHYM